MNNIDVKNVDVCNMDIYTVSAFIRTAMNCQRVSDVPAFSSNEGVKTGALT